MSRFGLSKMLVRASDTITIVSAFNSNFIGTEGISITLKVCVTYLYFTHCLVSSCDSQSASN